MSWADMAQEDKLAAAAEEDATTAAADDGEDASDAGRQKVQLSRDQREQWRYWNLVRKKDYICLERVGGCLVNILEGLELHTGVFTTAEQSRIIECVYELQERGKRGELGDRAYTGPQKWMRGKGRVTIQFGCCYNYATLFFSIEYMCSIIMQTAFKDLRSPSVSLKLIFSWQDKNGNPPGIIQTIISDPMPHLLKIMIKRLVRWNVLPTTCVPDSCIVNIYEPGDCIPPHIDSHDFVRPFFTVSFLSECSILFGTTLKVAASGEFIGSFAIPLPVGSVLVLNGNGADVAKHCVPAVPTKRILITFRKMDPAKRPFNFKDDPELLNIDPLETGRSSDEGKSKLPDVQIRNLSKISRGKRSKGKGRTAAGKAEGGFLRDQQTGHAQSHAVDVLSQQNLHGQQNVSAAISEGERNSAGRSRESKYHSNVPGMHSQVDLLRRHGNGMSASEDGVESWERKPAMEHRQISMINRTIKDGVDSFSVSSRESPDRPRSTVQTKYKKPRRTRVILDD